MLGAGRVKADDVVLNTEEVLSDAEERAGEDPEDVDSTENQEVDHFR
jgi:hypothetical protein